MSGILTELCSCQLCINVPSQKIWGGLVPSASLYSFHLWLMTSSHLPENPRLIIKWMAKVWWLPLSRFPPNTTSYSLFPCHILLDNRALDLYFCTAWPYNMLLFNSGQINKQTHPPTSPHQPTPPHQTTPTGMPTTSTFSQAFRFPHCCLVQNGPEKVEGQGTMPKETGFTKMDDTWPGALCGTGGPRLPGISS